MNGHGYTRKVGFKKGNKHSPHGQRRFPEAPDDSAATAAFPTTAARDLLIQATPYVRAGTVQPVEQLRIEGQDYGYWSGSRSG